MSVRRGHAGKVDLSQPEIIDGLRKAGICATSIAQVGGGCPDILAAWRGVNVLLECKTGNRDLNKQEQDWHDTWAGQVAVVRSAEEAIIAVTRYVEGLLEGRAA